MLNWLSKLVSKEDLEVDSIIVAGLLAVVAMTALTAYAVWAVPASFSPIAFGTGAASVLGTMGAGKRLRDGPTNQGDGK